VSEIVSELIAAEYSLQIGDETKDSVSEIVSELIAAEYSLQIDQIILRPTFKIHTETRERGNGAQLSGYMVAELEKRRWRLNRGQSGD